MIRVMNNCNYTCNIAPRYLHRVTLALVYKRGLKFCMDIFTFVGQTVLNSKLSKHLYHMKCS